MTWLHWSLLSALFAGLTAIFAKVGVSGIDSNLATAIRTSMVVIFTWIVAFVARSPTTTMPSSRRTWVYLALSALATGLSWLCYFRALQLGPASKVAPIDKLSVVLVILFAALFLGERLSPMKVAGGSLIALGAAILALE